MSSDDDPDDALFGPMQPFPPQHDDSIIKALNQLDLLQGRALPRLQREIAELVEVIDRDIAYIAPCRTLPRDVLSLIIESASTSQDADAQLPRRLSQVCRTWREVTITSPRAWSRIGFRYTSQTIFYALSGMTMYIRDLPGEYLYTLPDLRLWLARSAVCPKDVYVDYSDMPLDLFERLFSIVTAHSQYFRSVIVHFPRAMEDAQRVVCFRQLFMPPMRFLEYADFTAVQDRRGAALWSILPNVPHLTSAVVQSTEIHDLPPSLRARVSSLCILGGENMSSLITLCQLPRLRSLSVGNVSKIPSELETAAVASRLVELYMALENSCTTAFFSTVRLPQLKRLGLEKASDVAGQLRALVTTSQPPLQELYLDTWSLADDDMLDILCRLPLLTRFVLVGTVTQSDNAINVLAASRDTICPRLEDLCIRSVVLLSRCAVPTPITPVAMERLAVARSLRRVHLNGVTLHTAPRWEWEAQNTREDLFISDSWGKDRKEWWQVCVRPTVA